ncbi:MAG: hypothetical protein FWH47_01380 [Methanomassiliicoccaceae archaeon]|nr:hypothetical protein [Methanomassiliicoccaceae archaeon]
MMSITVSPEAEKVKDTIMDAAEADRTDLDVLMEALCALVIEFAGSYMDDGAGRRAPARKGGPTRR